jgi:hypothetical protein
VGREGCRAGEGEGDGWGKEGGSGGAEWYYGLRATSDGTGRR